MWPSSQDASSCPYTALDDNQEDLTRTTSTRVPLSESPLQNEEYVDVDITEEEHLNVSVLASTTPAFIPSAATFGGKKFGAPTTIELERMSQVALRSIILIFWFALICRMFVVIFTSSIYTCVNICGNICTYDSTAWDSSNCVSYSSNFVAWQGYFFDPNSNQFFDLEYYPVMNFAFYKEDRKPDGEPLIAEFQVKTMVRYEDGIVRTEKDNVEVQCEVDAEMCTKVVSDHSYRATGALSLTIEIDYPPDWMDVEKSQIMLLSHGSKYILFGILTRYFLLGATILVTLNFLFIIGFGRYNSWLTEQAWLVALLISLMIYLNPFYLIYVVSGIHTDSLISQISRYITDPVAGWYVNLQRAFQWVLLACIREGDKARSCAKSWITWIGLGWWLSLVAMDLVMRPCSATNTAKPARMHMCKATYLPLQAMSYVFVAGWLLTLLIHLLAAKRAVQKQNYFLNRHRQLALVLYLYLQVPYAVMNLITVWYLVSSHDYNIVSSYGLPTFVSPTITLSSNTTPDVAITSLFTLLLAIVYRPVVAQIDPDSPPPPECWTQWATVKWPEKWSKWLESHRGRSCYFHVTEKGKLTFERLQVEGEVADEEGQEDDDFIVFAMRYLFDGVKEMLDPITGDPTSLLSYFRAPPVRHMFCLELCVELFNMSYEVYFRNPEGQETPTNPLRAIDVARYGYNILHCVELEGVQILICEDGRRIVVAIRGTANKQNIQTDLALYRKKMDIQRPFIENNNVLGCFARLGSCLGIDVPYGHYGFQVIYSKIKGEILDLIRGTLKEYPNHRLHLTGHSLGGALANLVSYSVATELHQRVVCYTFGCPRVGNPTFAKYYNACVPDTFRIVNRNDIVTDNPPSFLLYYRHVGTEVFIDLKGNMIIGPSVTEKIFRPLKSGSALLAHSSGEYEKSLKAVCNYFSIKCDRFASILDPPPPTPTYSPLFPWTSSVETGLGSPTTPEDASTVAYPASASASV